MDPNAIYSPRRLRGAGSGTTHGAAAGGGAALAALIGIVGGKFCGNGGGIIVAAGTAGLAVGIGIGSGVSVFVGDTASGNACPKAPRNASAV
jgi:hypothetical protein